MLSLCAFAGREGKFLGAKCTVKSLANPPQPTRLLLEHKGYGEIYIGALKLRQHPWVDDSLTPANLRVG